VILVGLIVRRMLCLVSDGIHVYLARNCSLLHIWCIMESHGHDSRLLRSLPFLWVLRISWW